MIQIPKNLKVSVQFTIFFLNFFLRGCGGGIALEYHMNLIKRRIRNFNGMCYIFLIFHLSIELRADSMYILVKKSETSVAF